MIGSYILIFELKHDFIISIGKKGKITFRKGYYVYVGSALNGLEQRIKRHLKSNKRKHWHIDYLLEFALIKYIFIKESKKKKNVILQNHSINNYFQSKGLGIVTVDVKAIFFMEKKILFFILLMK
jgi:Uri superfamily endonuclease